MAAGPGFVVEMVNLAGRIWSTSGGAPQEVSTFTLNSFFNVGGDTTTDPRIIFDAGSSRWFASLSDEDADTVLVAVSSGPDPTASWSVHSFAAPGCADQPRLGVADGVVVLGADVFRTCDSRSPLLGSELWVVNKQQLLSGASTVVSSTYGPRSDYSSFAPVQSLSPTSTEYVVSVDEPRSSVVHLLSVTGIPPGPVQIQEVATPGIRPLSTPPDSPQPPPSSGHARAIVTNDNRLLDSVWENGKLWFAGNDRCTPAGDVSSRSCARIVELSTVTGSVDWDTDLGRKGGGVFYPALRPDAAGNIVIVYGESSSTLLPRVAAVARTPDGTFTAPVTIAQSSGPHVGDRYGDYFGAGRDPANPGVIWVVGETATAPDGGNGWGTAIGSLVVTPAGGTPPAAVALPPPALLAKPGTGKAGRRCSCATSPSPTGRACGYERRSARRGASSSRRRLSCER